MARLVVAVTGGIASGKSLVDRAFAALGVPVVDADVISREIVAPNRPALSEIALAFGAEFLRRDGTLDRFALRARVFDDVAARRKLEAITHPRIRALMFDRCQEAAGPYVVATIPLLAETGAIDAYHWLRRVLVVDAPIAVQRDRLMQREGIDVQLADKIIAAQATRSRRLSLASDVIINDASPSAVTAAVARLHAGFLALAQRVGPR